MIKNGIREKNKVLLATTITLSNASKQASKQAANSLWPTPALPQTLTNIGKRRDYLPSARVSNLPLSWQIRVNNAYTNKTRINNSKQHRSKENSSERKEKKNKSQKLAISSFNQPDTHLVYSRVQLDLACNRQSHEICFKEIPRWWSIIRIHAMYT